LPAVGEVLHVRRQLDRERLVAVDAALLAIEASRRSRAAVLLVELLDRRVAPPSGTGYCEVSMT
jgi:hypothetical protein